MSYYTVEVRRIDVIGKIWMPAVTAAMSYNLQPYDVENILAHGDGKMTREAVEDWLDSNSGDFQCVTDFRADIGPFFSDWADEENNMTFNDCMYPAED